MKFVLKLPKMVYRGRKAWKIYFHEVISHLLLKLN